MTLQEIAKKFPLGSLVIGRPNSSKEERIGICLGHCIDRKDEHVELEIAWILNRYGTFQLKNNYPPETISPYGEIDAVKTLIDFAGRLLESDLGKPDRKKLVQAIDTCEGAFGI